MRVVDVATKGMVIQAVFCPEGHCALDEGTQMYFPIVADNPCYRLPTRPYEVAEKGRVQFPGRRLIVSTQMSTSVHTTLHRPEEVAYSIDDKWSAAPLVLAVWVNRIPADPLVGFLFDRVHEVPGGFVMSRPWAWGVRTVGVTPSFDDVTAYFLTATVAQVPPHPSVFVTINMHPNITWWKKWVAVDATKPIKTLRHVRLTLPDHGEWQPVRINDHNRWDGPAHVFRALLPSGLPVSAKIAQYKSVVEAKPAPETVAT